MQTVLITGANGFVSWYLIRNLLSKPFTIVATGKGACRLPFQAPNLVYETLDFTDNVAVQRIFQKYTPHLVVHAGAESKPDACELHRTVAYDINVSGTENLVHAAARYTSYFLFVSTDFVFEGTSLQYKETDALNPVNYYGETKKLAETVVTNYPFRWGIVRTVLVYGNAASGRQNLLTMVAAALKAGTPLKIFSDQTRTPTYVEDLAAALTTMIEQQRTGIFHISGKDAVTPYEMAAAVAEHFGFDTARIENVTAETFHQPARRPPVTGFDVTKATTELFYTPTSFAEGLRKTFENLDWEGVPH